MKVWTLLLMMTASLVGCVTSGTYDESENARKAAETALAASKKEASGLGDQLKACGVERDTATNDLAACKQEVAAKASKTDELEGTANSLRDKLQTEISAKDVEIEQLKGKLSLHMLDRILFKSGSADILPDGKKALAKVASVLANSPELIRVEGHTDNKPVGGKLKAKYPSNWELSAARAASVVRLFEDDLKIDPKRMEVVGLSEFHPTADNEKPEDRERNRRVEIVLTSPKGDEAK